MHQLNATDEEVDAFMKEVQELMAQYPMPEIMFRHQSITCVKPHPHQVMHIMRSTSDGVHPVHTGMKYLMKNRGERSWKEVQN